MVPKAEDAEMKTGRRTSSIFSILALAASATAQSFEIASVRVSQPQQREYRFDTPASGVTAFRVPLGVLIRWAYGFHLSQKFWIDGPSWQEPGADVVRYDVVAKPSMPSAPEQLRAMMRGLLAERWGVSAHFETRVIPAYVLSVDKAESKLRLSENEGDGVPTRSASNLAFSGATIWQMIEEIGLQCAAPVVDETALAGHYDFTIEDFMVYGNDYSIPIPGTRGADFCPAWDQSLRKVGLRLKLEKRPIKLLIVDHAEKSPTAN